MNVTTTHKNVTSDLLLQSLRIISAALSGTALCISIFFLAALYTHYRSRQSSCRENGELVMILLEISQVLFCFFATIFFSIDAYILSMPITDQGIMLDFQGAFYYPTSASMGLRNVWIMFMTICRCVAVLKPLWTKIIFTKFRQITFFILTITYSMIGMLCVLTVYLLNSSFLYNMLIINSFALQILPMTIIFFTSVIIAVRLMSAQDAALVGALSRKSRLNATIITLSIAISCILFESFGVLLKIMNTIFTIENILQMQLNSINDILIALDTISHVVIFIGFSKSFRENLRHGGNFWRTHNRLTNRWSTVNQDSRTENINLRSISRSLHSDRGTLSSDIH